MSKNIETLNNIERIKSLGLKCQELHKNAPSAWRMLPEVCVICGGLEERSSPFFYFTAIDEYAIMQELFAIHRMCYELNK